MNIPIKKHTPVRYPKSKCELLLYYSLTGSPYSSRNNWSFYPEYPLVTDISTGLENPLWCEHIFPSDWNMYYNKDGTTYYAPPKPKSLWQKLTNKLRRK